MPAEGVSLPGADGDGLRSRLLAAAGKVRHPGLHLGYFTAEPGGIPGDEDELADDEDEFAGEMDTDDDDDVPAEEREPAVMRRAALLVAALDIVDECVDDLQLLGFGEDDRPDPEYAEDSFVYAWFPQRHRDAYDVVFFRRVLVTAVKVAADLADPRGGPAACTAEEMIRHAAGVIAGDLCQQAGLGRPWLDPDEFLLEDADFEFLYVKDMDGLEDDPAAQAALNVDVAPVQDWFAPFNSTRVVHPYAETSPSTPALHDLYRRLTGDHHPSELLEDDVVDAAAPLGSFAAGSEVVAMARKAAVAGAGLWVADDGDREQSFAALAAAAASADAGSGWLDWEPHDGADTIRAEPVITLSAHRHFPAGEDEPWVHAAIGGGRMLAIPLRFVVSYRPDPQVRQSWEQMHSDLLP